MEFIILILVIIIEITLKPRLDFTRGKKKLLLWYGKNKRMYIVIF